jgi:hypothetical protein
MLKEVRGKFKNMDNDRIESLDWSPWLDFDRETITNLVELEGVYKMHASMKILFIGATSNLRQCILGCLSDPCISKAQRFSYAITKSADKVKEELLSEYRNKHNGRLPSCMEQ